MPRVGNAEYEFVETQAAGRVLCCYCNTWHKSSDGEPMDAANNCLARFMRLRKVAVMVRGTVKSRGGGYRIPLKAEIDAAVAHAANMR